MSKLKPDDYRGRGFENLNYGYELSERLWRELKDNHSAPPQEWCYHSAMPGIIGAFREAREHFEKEIASLDALIIKLVREKK